MTHHSLKVAGRCKRVNDGRCVSMVRPDAPAHALAGITIVVMHIKPTFDANDAHEIVERELGVSIHGARVVVPRQADRFTL